MRRPIAGVLVSLAVLVAAAPGDGTEIRVMGFDQMVREAGVVVEVTVVKTEAVFVGSDVRQPKTKTATAPASAPEGEREDGEEPATQSPTQAPAAPTALAVEGGRRIYTEVTLEVGERLYGDVGGTMTLRVAGGTVGELTAVVFGMPRFEVGQRYVLFLVPDHESVNVPIVGVNQGYFQIVRDESGADHMLNANGDMVLGVEDDRVVVRRNLADESRRAPELGVAPTPEADSGVRSRISPAVARYWQSQEPPMRTESFFAKVRTMKQEDR